MEQAREVVLPSGAKLRIQVSPFSIAKNLYQAILEEAKSLKLDPNAEIDVNLWKDMFCSALSSKKIESALEECLVRCLYNGQKISQETWEPVKTRDDYLTACFEVAAENVRPFMKSLYAKYSGILGKLKNSPA